MHLDDLPGRDDREAAGVAEAVGIADQHYRQAGLGGLDGAGHDLGRGPVAAHGVHGDRPEFPPAGPTRPAGDGAGSGRLGSRLVSQRRGPGGPCTTRRSGTPRAGSLALWHWGQTLRAGDSSTQALARRLRLLALEVFFLGTAMWQGGLSACAERRQAGLAAVPDSAPSREYVGRGPV